MTFNLNTYLTTRKQRVEEHLFNCLPIDSGIQAPLTAAMRHAVRSGGKRLRPILCLAAAEAVNGKYEDVLNAASAVELLHTYTLVHDDLPCMDNDLLRRGQPTVHAKYGEAIGILAGDALQTLAFEILARTPEKQAGAVAQLITELAVAAGAAGVIAGQAEDIRCANTATREEITYIFQHKTADLFRTACRLGALAAGAQKEHLDQLSRYANGLGFAFQIIDDLLDAQGTDQDAPTELSCLMVMSAQEAREWAEQQTTRAIEALEGLPGETEPLAALAASLLQRLV